MAEAPKKTPKTKPKTVQITAPRVRPPKAVEMNLGPKGKDAINMMVLIMSKFRTDERARMVNYLKAWTQGNALS